MNASIHNITVDTSSAEKEVTYQFANNLHDVMVGNSHNHDFFPNQNIRKRRNKWFRSVPDLNAVAVSIGFNCKTLLKAATIL